jgi:TonB-linked SusC/RagA family outer membrane protein
MPHLLARLGPATAAGACAALATPHALRAQPPAAATVIEGTVRDAGSGTGLANAQVFVAGAPAGTPVGATTNAAGAYRIVNAPAGTVELRVRLLGFAQASQTVAVAPGRTARADFSLQRSAVQLDMVVTTGTGTAVATKKLGNTIATVNLADVEQAPVQTPTEVLAARVPGLSVLPSSGVTGAGARIRIRGSASLSQSNNPILYIDGVRADNGGSGGGAATSRLDDIDPNSIERIEVLKGAAAATLYGTEASNGVIQIFTKRGAAGPARWNVEYERSALAYPEGRIDANAGFARTQGRADTLSAIFGRTIAPYAPFTYNVSEQLWETGSGNVASASVNGGAERATYFVSARYQGEDGPFTSARVGGIARDVIDRYQGTLGLNIMPRDRLTLSLQSRYTAQNGESPEGSNSITSPYAQGMYARPEEAYCLDANGRRALGDAIAGPARCSGAGNPFGNTFTATVRETNMRTIPQDVSHYNGSLGVKWAPTAELSLDATGGLDYTDTRNVNFWPFGNRVDLFNAGQPEGSRSVGNVRQRNVTLDVKGSWDRALTSALQSTLVLGTQGFVTNQKTETGSDRDFAGPGLGVIGAGSRPGVGEGLIKVVNAGYFAQEQLGVRDWIFLTGGARYDYNSAFGESAGGVLYPKVSVSLVPSDLASWQNGRVAGLLSSARLRAALGRSGRQPGAFDKFTTFTALPSSTGGGLIPLNLGNPDLRPEVSTEWEAGGEFGLFRDRASLSVTHWNRQVDDALVQKLFPGSGGFTASQLTNVGRLNARGWELALTGFVVNRPNLALDLFANGAHLWQKVTSLGGAAPIKITPGYVRTRGFIREGYAPGSLFGAKILQPCASYANAANDAKGGCLQPGQTPYDLNNDRRPDTEAELLAALASPRNPTALALLRADDDGNGDFLDHYQGKPFPDWSGAFGGNLRLGRGWRVGTLFEYKGGNYTITNLTDAFRNASPAIGRNNLESATVEATLLNPASTAQQRLDAARQWLGLVALSPYDGYNQNDPGDFLRWRELSLAYTTSPRLAARVGARDMQLRVAVRNLMLWTRYPGTDPEANERGVSSSLASNQLENNFYDASDTFGLPLPRRLSLSVRLGY